MADGQILSIPRSIVRVRMASICQVFRRPLLVPLGAETHRGSAEWPTDRSQSADGPVCRCNPRRSPDRRAAPTGNARRYDSPVPVEPVPGVLATLVLGYRTAVRVLYDPERFPKDPYRAVVDLESLDSLSR